MCEINWDEKFTLTPAKITVKGILNGFFISMGTVLGPAGPLKMPG
jgi:hypothetical protein